MNTGSQIHGFRLLEERPLEEIQSVGRLFEHEKTGARLLQLENDDDNKVFSVGFRTPSKNSTGVAHIIEHCLLGGSKKYTTKEPFMDMVKTSLSTFLNAMTFSDKTLYPVGSRNAKDFSNLMDVYLDAVFHPLIYDRKELFLQEGWHYHLEREEDPIVYKGVVYNEMRGALSSPEEQVANEIYARLYPDTVYGYESGGDPYVIPELTYEAFLDFHRTYYHPSNSYLYLYGDVDLDASLAHIASYLDEFDALDVDSALTFQPPFEAPRRDTAAYSVSPEEENPKEFWSYGTMFGSRLSHTDNLAYEILSEALVDSQAAPLKNALLAANLCEDVYSLTKDGIQIPFCIVAQGAEAGREEEFHAIIAETLESLIRDGIDRDLLASALNKTEYYFREAQGINTRGIFYLIQAFETWLYDESPFDALAYEDSFRTLREWLKTDRFEKLLEERILKNPHTSLLRCVPEPGRNIKKDAEVAASLASYKESLSPEALKELIGETQRLLRIQNTPDSPEQKATIPKLTRDDVDPKIPEIPREEVSYGESTLLYHDLFTGQITYLDMAFDIAHIEKEELCLMTLACELIGSMNTEKYDYARLGTLEFLSTGGITLTPMLFRDWKNPDTFYPKLLLSTKFVGAKQGREFFHLAEEIMAHTDFSDKKRMREVVQSMKTTMESNVFRSGHAVTLNRVTSYFSSHAAYQEHTAGLELLFYIQNLDKHFDERFDELRSQLENLVSRLFTNRKLVVSVTADAKDAEELTPHLKTFLDKLPSRSYAPADLSFPVEQKNEGILSASGVQFVAVAGPMAPGSFRYNGELEVLANILTNDYLFGAIRAKGGAYGTGIQFNRSGIAGLYSYRDPNSRRTLETYGGLPDFLESLELSEAELESTILGTVNKFDPPMTAYAKGRRDLSMYLTGLTTRALEDSLKEALDTDVTRLKSYAPALRQVIESGYLCILGNDATLREEASLFHRLIALDGGKRIEVNS